MSFFKKQHNEEDPLVPILFGEISENELSTVFPETEEISDKHSDAMKQALLNRTNDDETRKQIIAWNELRKLSVFPDETIADRVLGFIIEVGVKKGVDYLAVYADNCARYYNFSGAKIIYEAYDCSINDEIQKLLDYCKVVVHTIGVWDGDRRKPPTNNVARVNFLTPSGLFFGEGPFDILSQEALLKDVVAQSVVIMLSLTSLRKEGSGTQRGDGSLIAHGQV